MKLETIAVHGGQKPDPTTKAVAVPIYQTVAYAFDDTQHGADLFDLKVAGNIYTRIMNPTQDVLEKRVAEMEGGIAALAMASGMAAITAAIQTIAEAGDNIVSVGTLYGGTYNLFAHTLPQYGIEVRFADYRDPASFKPLIDARTKAVYCESIGNPLGNIIDLAAIAEVAHAAGVPLIVDNTSASPWLCRPFEMGADLVVHSTTKYLTGNGTVTGGAVVDAGRFDWSASDKFPSLSRPEPAYHGLTFHETFGPMAFTFHGIAVGLRDLGMTMSPTTAFQTLLGIETLSLRMERHVSNARQVAAWLEAHPAVAHVTYAGLPSSPYADRVARLYPRGAGALFTFALKGGYEACVRLVDAVELFSHVANLGDTRSLIIHSASTTHRQLTPEQQTAAGAGPDVVRLSIGIEDVADIIADLDQALAKATA